MLYFRGDLHGKKSSIAEMSIFCDLYNVSEEDYIVLLGDVGANFYFNGTDKAIKKMLSDLPGTILAVHGNHEARPESISTYKEIDFMGGKAMVEDEFPKLIFLKDGEEYNIDGKAILCLGGAYSVDKYYRVQNGIPWFRDEQTSKDKREEILNKVKGRHFDYVVSHTCPYEWQPFDLFLSFIDQSTVDNSQEKWLGEVEKAITYGKWYYGHFHRDRQTDNHVMLFNVFTDDNTNNNEDIEQR